MKKFKKNPVTEKKEEVVYSLFYFFIAMFLIKTVFGFMADSKILLVSGIFSLFGILTAIVMIMRLNVIYPFRGSLVRRVVSSFSQGKVEAIVIFAASAIIVISTSELIFSVFHMLFFHKLYPPQLLAAWAASAAGGGALVFMEWTDAQIIDFPEADKADISFVLQAEFILSILTVITVVLARMGAYVLDQVCAIFCSFFIIVYSARYIYAAFKDLMDGSCDKEIITKVKGFIFMSEGGHSLESLRVNKSGNRIEIIAFLSFPYEMSIKEVSDRIGKLKEILRKKLKLPHEMLVGISTLRKK